MILLFFKFLKQIYPRGTNSYCRFKFASIVGSAKKLFFMNDSVIGGGTKWSKSRWKWVSHAKTWGSAFKVTINRKYFHVKRFLNAPTRNLPTPSGLTRRPPCYGIVDAYKRRSLIVDSNLKASNTHKDSLIRILMQRNKTDWI